MSESTVFIYINSFKSHISFNEINPLVNPILGKKKKKGGQREVEKFVQGQIALLLRAELGFEPRFHCTIGQCCKREREERDFTPWGGCEKGDTTLRKVFRRRLPCLSLQGGAYFSFYPH